MNLRDAASERQAQAADPGASTWLSANAGSGKTRVLTDRVARLLLKGVMSQRILCLTFTKAAASEMQNRLFKRLGQWAMMPDAELRAELQELGGADAAIDLTQARTLFARAIETPGGLKIQTIHSFCASLLRRFPLEAGVSPQFTEIDDRAAKLLRADIVEAIAEGPDCAALDALAAFITQDTVERLTAEIVRRQIYLPEAPDRGRVWDSFGLPAGFGPNTLEQSLFSGDEADLITSLVTALAAGSANDVKAADKLRALTAPPDVERWLPVLANVMLFGSGAKANRAKIGSFPTKATIAKILHLMPALDDLMQRVEDAEARRKALLSAQQTFALHYFGSVFLKAYRAQKMARGWLDFDDLILQAAALLDNPAVAAWVLFRLDGGIDHILVDEAQDTSPAQWRVIRLLAQEFTAGEGARAEAERTLFVVGDKKQSIYAFQGADPDGFDEMQAHFGGSFRDIGAPFQSLQLEYSFRSSDPILRLTDFALEDYADAGLGDVKHLAFHDAIPGRVDLWPIVEKAETDEAEDWFDPVDRPAPQHHDRRLAQMIARDIQRMIAQETLPQTDGTRRPVRAGDILVLVRSRNMLFHEIILTCRAAGLPMAGADRLRIGGELAVKDLTALLAFLATPEDDLSLATALRSPLFGWSEQELFDLAAKRTVPYLWAALRERSDHVETRAMLDDLRSDADFLRPYDLLERILTRHGGRAKLLARLGAEAEDGIDALLAQALNYERIEIPSLTGFIAWVESGDVEIKRQVDSVGDQIRVMTVHGAKGLEAPIVILPDTLTVKKDIKDQLLVDEDGLVIWRPKAEGSGALVTETLEHEKAKQEAERFRLLYVAMTRAERWLIVAGAGDRGKAGDTWYDLIETGLDRAGAVTQGFEGGDGVRLQNADWNAPALVTPDVISEPPVTLPSWAQRPAEVPERPAQTLSPSDLGGAKALAGEGSGSDPLRYGRMIHRLLEHLPGIARAEWDNAAPLLLQSGEDIATSDEARETLSAAVRVLDDPSLAHVFGPDALAEVEITADLPELGGRIRGAIDRLVVTDSTVLAVDFKSNTVIPERAEDTPLGLIRQMAAYGAALHQIYPNHAITCAILWTRGPQIMSIPHEVLRSALAQPLHLDPAPSHP